MLETGESGPWYEAPKASAHSSLIAQLGAIRQEQAWRDALILQSLRLYGGRPLGEYGPENYAATDWAGRGDRSPTNVVRRIVSTVTSKAVQSRPRPMVVTTRGKADLRRRADRSQRWLDGSYAATKVYARKYPLFVRDAALFGTGFLAVSSAYDRLAVDSVFPAEMAVDEYEAIDGNPRSLYRSRFADRRVLARMFPKQRDEIMDCDGSGIASELAGGVSHRRSASQICLVEAWHLPSGPDAGDGRRVIAIDSCALLDEEWTRESFPFITLHWEPPVQGFWGIGLAEICSGSQVTLNELNKTIRNAQRLAGTWQIWNPRGSNVNKASLNNAPGNIVDYDGPRAPTRETNVSVPVELYNERRYQVENAYAEAGVSELAVQAQKPAGLDSGKAIRAFADIGSERFARFMFDCNEAVGVALAEAFLAEANEIPSYSVTTVDRKGLERLSWSEVKLPRDSFAVVIAPGSALPTTPAGRIAAADDMLNSGMLGMLGISNPSTMAQLYGPAVPDLETQIANATAPADWIEFCLDHICEHGECVQPQSLMDLQLALSMGLARLAMSATQDVEPETLDLLRDWIADVKEMIKPTPKEEPAADAAAPVDPNAMPPGDVQPPPDLIPPPPGPESLN